MKLNKLYKYFKKIMKISVRPMMLDTKKMFKEFFNKEHNKKQRANMWSFTRLITPFVSLAMAIIASLIGGIIPLIICGSIAGFGALTDYFDGKSARKYKSFSEYGKKLDQVADKVWAAITGLTVAVINPIYIIPLVLEVVIGNINLSYFVKYPNLSNGSSKLGKIKQWPLMISFAIGFISSINLITQTISYIMIAVTSAFQIATAYNYFHLRKTEKALYNLCEQPVIDKKIDPFNTLNKKTLAKNLKPSISNNIHEINDQKRRRELLVKLNMLKQELNTETLFIYKEKEKIKLISKERY